MKRTIKVAALSALLVSALLFAGHSNASANTRVTVYVVDTGIKADHASLAGSVGQGVSRIKDALGTGDCNGHGTHVAGVIRSVAPDALLVPVRAFNCGAIGWSSDVAAGIDWAVADHQAGVPAVMNLSISGSLSNVVNMAVSRAIADGIIVIVASGNNANDACKYSPGSVADAITVAAVDLSAVRYSHSNVGSCVDVFAPGVSIVSAWHTSTTATKMLKGTSQAAPFVTGFAASVLATNPATTMSEMTAIVRGAAVKSVVGSAGTNSPTAIIDPLSLVLAAK